MPDRPPTSSALSLQTVWVCDDVRRDISSGTSAGAHPVSGGAVHRSSETFTLSPAAVRRSVSLVVWVVVWLVGWLVMFVRMCLCVFLRLVLLHILVFQALLAGRVFRSLFPSTATAYVSDETARSFAMLLASYALYRIRLPRFCLFLFVFPDRSGIGAWYGILEFVGMASVLTNWCVTQPLMGWPGLA